MNKVLKHSSIVLVSGFLIYAVSHVKFLHLLECPLYYIIGIPCPTCGMTRAFDALMHLDIMQAFYYNPSFILVIVVLITFIFEDYIKPQTVKKIYLASLVVLVLIYIFRMLIYFPNHEVLNYNHSSLLNKLLK